MARGRMGSNPGSDDFTQKAKLRKMELKPQEARTKAMKDAAVILPWDSYVGRTNTLGSRRITESASVCDVGTTQPDLLSLHELDDSSDVVLVPTLVQDTSTIKVAWNSRGIARFDLSTFLANRRFPVPRGTKAVIPFRREPIDEETFGVRMCLSEATFEEIEEGTKRSKKNGDKGTGAAQAKAPEAAPKADKPSKSDSIGA